MLEKIQKVGDEHLLRWVFKQARSNDGSSLYRQGVWDYMTKAIKFTSTGGWDWGELQDDACRQAIARDVGFGATILMLGFVPVVADLVRRASEQYRCIFVEVTDKSASPRWKVFIMCALLALGAAHYLHGGISA